VNLKLLVDDEGQLLATAASIVLPVDSSYHHLCGMSIQKKIRTRQAYYSVNVIIHILSRDQNCNICECNAIIDGETASKIKMGID